MSRWQQTVLSTPRPAPYRYSYAARPTTGAWLWHHQQRRYVARPDYPTTTADVATAITHGDDGGGRAGVLAADYWVLAARTLAETASDRATQAEQRDHAEGTFDSLTDLAAARRELEQASAILGQLTAIATTAHVRQFLAHADGDLGALWRAAAQITYHDHVIAYGNDGPPETDRALPDTERAQQLAAIELIAQHTGLPAGFIRTELDDAAYAHGQAPGTDDDPDHFPPPDWQELTTRYAELSGDYAEQRLTTTHPRGINTMDADYYSSSDYESDNALADADDETRGTYWDAINQRAAEQDPVAPSNLEPDASVEGERACAEIRPEAGEYALYIDGEQIGRFPTAEDAELAREVLTRPLPTGAPQALTAAATAGNASVSAEHDSGGAVDPSAEDSAFALIAELDVTEPDPYPGDESAFWQAHTRAPAATVAEELDQARARLESGDIPAEREHEQAEYIEHLEDQLANTLLPTPADSASKHAPSQVALNAALANELDGLADMVDLGGDPAADAWLKAEACGRREVYALLRQRAAHLRQHPDTTIQAVAQASNTDCATARCQDAPARAAENVPDNPAADQVEYWEQQTTSDKDDQADAASQPAGRQAATELGKDPLDRARHTIDHLHSTGHAHDAPARADRHLDRERTDQHIRGLSSGDEAGATGRDEPGW